MDRTEEIPWVDITQSHMSNLRGHVRYLKNIGAKLNVADKLEDYNKRAAQTLADAEAAALIAGIEITPKSKPNVNVKEPTLTDTKRRRLRSPERVANDADLGDNEVSKPKKVKFCSPVAALVEKTPGFAHRALPTAAEIASLSSRLGKHERPQDPSFEVMTERGMKRTRNRYIEKKDRRRQQFEGEKTDDSRPKADVEFAPIPDHIRDRLPPSTPAPTRRGTRPFTNELVVPVETNDSTPAGEDPTPPAPTTVASESEGVGSSTPNDPATISPPKAIIPAPSQASHPKAESKRPTAPNDPVGASDEPTAAQASQPEANKSRKRTTANSSARASTQSTNTSGPAQPSQVVAKASKHGAEEDITECPPTVKKQKKYIQFSEGPAKRSSTIQNDRDEHSALKRRKVVGNGSNC